MNKPPQPTSSGHSTTGNAAVVQSRSLHDYQLGDSLGKGAFGQVYRALNWATGETVAIKQISLNNIPASQLSSIMSEISLLKNLRHPNIVKYKGFVKTRMHLYIILEFCENGSLSQIGKRFGKFPEGLVGVYVSQVLEGLCYLHEQGVIHRDIKGANILTNKDGTVKLADFGVASSTTVPSGSSSADVVGSPYWMAPEVIEQSGATTASDIWSLGCVVIELLEGSPPYSFLDPMPALWRIVQDDCPPIPEGASAVVKDFLACCFQKDPNLRIGARKLLRHPWMAGVRARARSVKHTSSTAAEGRPVSQYGYDEVVQKVQEWNQALSSAANLSSLPASASVVTPVFTAPPSPSSDSSGKKDLQHYRKDLKGKGKGPTLITPSLNPLGSFNALGGLVTFVEEEDESNPNRDRWDDDFDLGEDDEDFAARSKIDATKSKMDTGLANTPGYSEYEAARGTSSSSGSGSDSEDVTLTSSSKMKPHRRERDDRTIRASPGKSLSLLPTSASSSSSSPSRLSSSPPRSSSSRPAVAASMTRSISDHVTVASSGTTYYAISEAEEENYDDDFLNDEDGEDEDGKALLERRVSEFKYTELSGQEVEAEDFDYEINNNSPSSTVGSGEGGFKLERPGLLKLNSRLSNRSWLDEDDSSDEDVFAEFDEPFAEDDLQTHIQRDKQARLSARVNALVDDLSFNASPTGNLLTTSTGAAGELKDGRTAREDRLRDVVWELLNIIIASPEMQIQLVSSHGMLAILELLRIVNLLVTENVSFLESFCLIGGIPVVMGFTSKRFPSECRLEASNFIRLLCHTSVLTLQMFISCRGLKVLVDLLDEDCSSASQAPLVAHALNGVSSVFDLQSPTTKNDFCRMFVREGLLEPLSGALLNVMANVNTTFDGKRKTQDSVQGLRGVEDWREEENVDGAGLESGMKMKIIRILLVFSQVSQSDSYVRHAVGTRKVIRRLLRACELLEPGCLVLMLKAVKHLSMNISLLDVLQNANTIEILVRILEEQASSPHSTEMSNHIFQTCFNLCRLNKSRQEEAAQAGIIPCLQRVAETQSPLKQFALPILCDMASAGKSCRMLLWQHDGLSMYLRLLEDPYFQVSALESILSWLQDEPARVEDELMRPNAIRSVLDCFVTSKANSFENLLELFLKLTRISSRITTAFSRSAAFFRKVADRLGHNTKPVVRLNLLRILKFVCDAHPNRGILVERYGSGGGLLGVLEGLSRGGGDGVVLIRELAKEIIQVLRPGLKPLPGGSRVGSRGVTPKRMRRTASETSAVTVATHRHHFQGTYT
ncbi:hypothetical protein F5050DRAFT_1800256 [Lentinula boryana]|uniref:non-specific serine/threonine protein kinase n=3 Tax=Lentinula TaxID=5352 RepID=A0ABQ8Q9Z7_9AGAR|nr:hypothetical protein F5050DRAFT_1800256 [Lentinula boryana]